jgi:hypothetical protein
MATKHDGSARQGRWGIRVLVPVVLPVFLACPAWAAEAEVEPQADAVLRAMSDYLANQRIFSFSTDSSTDVVLSDGRKIELTATSEMVVDRETGMRVDRQGPLGNTLFVYDGAKVSILSEREGVYLSLPVSGGLDAAIDEVRSTLGTEVAGGADLLYSNAYDGLMLNVASGHYMGKAVVSGVLTDHLSYRAEDIDWQLWVRSEGDPVPVKYVITSKWVTAAPQFSVEISDFKILTETSADTFVFTPSAGAREITPDQLPEFDLLAEE